MKLLALTKSSTRCMKERKAQMARDEDTTERGGAYVIHQGPWIVDVVHCSIFVSGARSEAISTDHH